MSTRVTWAGYWHLRADEMRRLGIEFADVAEVAGGDPLTGTPTVTVSGTGLTVSSPAIADTTSVDFWLEAAADAAAGERTVTVKVSTTAGAEIVRVATAKVEE